MKIRGIIIYCLAILAVPCAAEDHEVYSNRGTTANVMFVLDASGSMLLKEDGSLTDDMNETRMTTLSNALTQVVNKLGDTNRLKFGLTWYGGPYPGGIKLPMRTLGSNASNLHNVNYSADFSGDEIDFGSLFLNTFSGIFDYSEYDPSGLNVKDAGLYDGLPIHTTSFDISKVPACAGKTVGDLRAEVTSDSRVNAGFSDHTSTSGGVYPQAYERPFNWHGTVAGSAWPMSATPVDSDSVPATWVDYCPQIPAECDESVRKYSGGNFWDPDECEIGIHPNIDKLDLFIGDWPQCEFTTPSGQPETVQVHGCENQFYSLFNEAQELETRTIDALYEVTRYFRGDKVFFGNRDHFPPFDQNAGRYFDPVTAASYSWPGYTGDATNSPDTYSATGMPGNNMEFLRLVDFRMYARNYRFYQDRLSGPLFMQGWRAVNPAAVTPETRDQRRRYLPKGPSSWINDETQELHTDYFRERLTYEPPLDVWNLFYNSINAVNLVESPYPDFDNFLATNPSLFELWRLENEDTVTAGGVTYKSITGSEFFDCSTPSEYIEYCTANLRCPAENDLDDCVDLIFGEFHPDGSPWCESFEVGGEWIETYTGRRECDFRYEAVQQYESPISECSNQAIVMISDGYPRGNFSDTGGPLAKRDAALWEYNEFNLDWDSPGLIRQLLQENTDKIWFNPANRFNARSCVPIFDTPGVPDLSNPEWVARISSNCATELVDFLATTPQIADNPLSKVSTHAIGFNIDSIGKHFLTKLTEAGNGIYSDATNQEELTEAVEEMIALAKVPTVDTPSLVINLDNSNLTTENVVYAPVFMATDKPVWAANVKAYFLKPETDDDDEEIEITEPYVIDGLRSFWSHENTLTIPLSADDPLEYTTLHGGVNTYLVESDKAANPRHIFLEKEVWEDGANGQAYKIDHATNPPTAAYLGIEDAAMTEADNAAAAKDLTDWYQMQPLGDSLHSKPVLVDYTGSFTLANGATVNNPRLMFVVSNRGLVHAFDISDVGKDADGSGDSFIRSSHAPTELGAWMPYSLATNIAEQKNAEIGDDHIYGLDGEIRIWKEPIVNTECTGTGSNEECIDVRTYKTYLLLGMRRGGNAYYKLDISTPGQFDVDWRIDPNTAGFSDLGQSWSPISVMKVRGMNNEEKYLGVFGGGYDEVDDIQATTRLDTTDQPGAGLYLVDMDDGSLVASVGHNDSSALYKHANMRWGIPSEIRVIDSDGDGFADRLYYGDMGGQLWRTDVNTAGGSSSLYLETNMIMDTGDNSAIGHRRIHEPPSAAFLLSGEIAVVASTGYRSHPLNGIAGDPDTGIRYPVIQDGVFMMKDRGNYPLSVADLVDVTTDSVTLSNDASGWMIRLKESQPNEETGAVWVGEKVLSEPVVFDSKILFTSTIPQSGSDDPCSVSETENRFYSISLYNGSPSGDLYKEREEVIASDSDNSGDLDEVVTVRDPVRFVTLDSSNAIESEMAISVDPDKENCADGKACGDFFVGTQSVAEYELVPAKVYWKETANAEQDERFE